MPPTPEQDRVRQEAELHDIITSLWMLVDPEYVPTELQARIDVVLGATDPDGHCGNPICAQVAALQATVEERTKEREEALKEAKHLRTELLFIAHREYDDNPGRAFDNRRKLAVSVAQHLGVSDEERRLMVAAAPDHAGTGGEIIEWLVNHYRQTLADLQGEIAQVVRGMESWWTPDDVPCERYSERLSVDVCRTCGFSEHAHEVKAWADRLARLQPYTGFGGPITLTEAQEAAAKEWAADDRLWTTQETVEANLRTFARVILKPYWLARLQPPTQEQAK